MATLTCLIVLVHNSSPIPSSGIRSGQGYKVTIARLLRAEAENEEEHYQRISEFADGTATEK